MGFEVIDRDNTTPQRLITLLQLVAKLGCVRRRDLLELLQPVVVLNDRESSREISERLLRAAVLTGLIIETPSADREMQLGVSTECVGSFEDVRALLQSKFLGKSQENQDHYLLNLFAAWYAVQDQKVFDYSRVDLEARFNDQLYPGTDTRVFREKSDFNAWRNWAEFLGWGWTTTFGPRPGVQFVPDATVRIRSLLPRLVPAPETDLSMNDFMAKLAALCPELDGGILFIRCWQAGRDVEQGNRISLMVSTALRVLHASGEIALIERKDAAPAWSLFPAQSHTNRVTDIRRALVGAVSRK
jgi:hypothetical protein